MARAGFEAMASFVNQHEKPAPRPELAPDMFLCLECGAQFPTQMEMRAHLLDEHEVEPDDPAPAAPNPPQDDTLRRMPGVTPSRSAVPVDGKAAAAIAHDELQASIRAVVGNDDKAAMEPKKKKKRLKSGGMFS
jgi:hypothetical protein